MALRATDSKKLIRRLLDLGLFVVPTGEHARRELVRDGLTDLDAINVLRAGSHREAEWENGSWRYIVETPQMRFVVMFRPEVDVMIADGEPLGDLELILVTGMRIRK